MTIFLQIIVGLLIAPIFYWWVASVNKIRTKLKWIPEPPRVPILGNALEIKEPIDTVNVFRKYLEQYDGLCTIDLFTSKIIITSDPTFLEFVLGNKEFLNKSDDYRFFANWLGTGLLTAQAEKWKKTRKMLTPSFNFSILDSFIDIFESNADTLIELLEKETSEDSVDLFPYIVMATLDIICETAMGVSINAQRNPTSDYILAVREEFRIMLERSFSFLKSFDFIYRFTSDYYKELECIKILHSHTLDVIRTRKEKVKKKTTEQDLKNNDLGIKKRKVFLDTLLETNLDGRPLTDTEIREEVDTFMLGGHDTTAPVISFALYCISLNKDVQDKIIHEQKDIFGNDRDRPATNRDLQEMKYLEQTLKETLRVYPPIPFIGRTAHKDVEYKDGNVIPAGTRIYAVLYCANRNPKIFPDPDKFDPDRFESNSNIPSYAYVPFSAGPRNCIGQKYALNVMRSIISKVVRNFEILPCGHEIKLSLNSVLNSETGIKVKLRKRDWDKI